MFGYQMAYFFPMALRYMHQSFWAGMFEWKGGEVKAAALEVVICKPHTTQQYWISMDDDDDVGYLNTIPPNRAYCSIDTFNITALSWTNTPS